MPLKINLGKTPLNFSTKIIITIALTAITLGLISYYAILPSVGEIMQIKEEIEKKKAELEVNYIKGDETGKLMKDMDMIKEWEGMIDSVYLTKNQELIFITELEKIAASNHVDQKISLGQPKTSDKSKFYQSSLEINSTGRFFDIMKYLKDLESADFYLNINNISLSSGPSGSKSKFDKNLQDNVALRIYSNYYLKD